MNEEEKKKEQQYQQQAQQGKTPASTTAHVDNNGAAVPVAAPAPTPAPSPTANDLQQRLYGNRLTGSNEATRSYDAVAPAVPAPAKVQNQAPARTQAPTPVKKDPYHLDELAQKISAFEENYQPLTKQDLERERKKKKREAIFSALGDGISALSNLYFTTQGANNAYDPANSLSAKAKERWDKAKAERQEMEDRYLAYLYREREMAERNKRSDEAAAARQEDKETRDKWRQEDVEHRDKVFDQNKEQQNKDNAFREQSRQDSLNEAEKARQERQKDRQNAATIASTRANSSGSRGGSSSESNTSQLYNIRLAEIYASVPDSYKENVGVIRTEWGAVAGHRPPTREEMEVVVGQAGKDHEEIRKAYESLMKKNSSRESSGGSEDDWSQYETGGEGGEDWSQYEQ